MLKICLVRMRTDICRQVAREENFVVIFSHLIARLPYGRLRERELKKKDLFEFRSHVSRHKNMGTEPL